MFESFIKKAKRLLQNTRHDASGPSDSPTNEKVKQLRSSVAYSQADDWSTTADAGSSSSSEPVSPNGSDKSSPKGVMNRVQSAVRRATVKRTAQRDTQKGLTTLQLGNVSNSNSTSTPGPSTHKTSIWWPASSLRWVRGRADAVTPTTKPFLPGGYLGGGAFGAVYLVLDVVRRQSMAMKVVHYTRDFSPPECRGLVAELRILQRLAEEPQPFLLRPYLDHRLWAWHTSLGYVHMLTEFCPGGDLRSYVGYLTDQEVWLLTAELVLALEWLHKQGFVHHDIKPGNILVDNEGHCLLGDFGACRELDRGVLRRCDTDDAIRTDEYAAPELLSEPTRRWQWYDKSVDLWSLGVVIAEVFTGISSFVKGPNVSRNEFLASLSARVEETFARLEVMGRPDMSDLLQGMLVIDPYGRMSTSEIQRHRGFSRMRIKFKDVRLRKQRPIRKLHYVSMGDHRRPSTKVPDYSPSKQYFLDELAAQCLTLEQDDSFEVSVSDFRPGRAT
ncbi:uncharacterized protein FIBRA_04119 [Fibroporia radiculosa]|uniref:Protein kinase domain-containing protein n=1 Tax=Fibroporia radiculosa TaxID=599839 RepID=J4G6V3_9APHY|nr:uncharacterized protein FIBRA_04119 [Fibroporia radiculosa]CCM02043.1 predicted protein [Fibroporia radiculosa]